MDYLMTIAVAVASLACGLLVIGVFLHKKQLAAAFETAKADSTRILEEARKEADSLIKQSLKDAKEESRRSRQAFDDEARTRRGEITKLEQKIKGREETLDKKISVLESKERSLDSSEKKLHAEEQRYSKLIIEHESTVERSRRTLQTIANMSPEEAKRELMKSMEVEARRDAQEVIRRIEEETRIEADTRARAVVSLAVQRVAGEFVSDSTVSVVSLPSEDMKGRIIGREGRNIRAIEQATGVDLIIDDTPEAVIISCFNPIRREIAKVTLERLIGDGRIHPARIDETVKRVESEFDQILSEYGEQACFDTGITDVHPEIVKLIGKLRFRTSGQKSILLHSVETAQLCGIMAGEMGLNVKRAKRMGLFHDIGKAVDQDTEGHHAVVGADICAKYNEPEEVVEAIRLHHADEIANGSAYAVILHTANVLSSSRPGARKEALETYVKRLEDMETIIKGFPGIQEAYVIQAGREVRAIVNPTGVSDSEVVDLSNDIASKLRQELTFPGQVRVTVVRESRATDYAK